MSKTGAVNKASAPNEQQPYRRLVRRSLHRSRSTAVVITLTVLALTAVYVGIECVLAALELSPLLISPAGALTAAETLPIAAGLAILGLILLVAALTPGRRSRHELPNPRLAVVVDDAILAGAIGKAVTRVAALPASRVSTVLSRTKATVRVVPTSGLPLDTAVLTTAATALVTSLDPSPAIAVDVTVEKSGVVGS